MSGLGLLILFFAVGVLLLVAEIFIPSYGILCVSGTGFLIAGILKTFEYGGRGVGVTSILACAVFLPVFAYVAVKYWRRTPIGRRIAPPNPVLTAEDVGVPSEELRRLVGQTGEAQSPLRPVGICLFNGRRVNCIARFGLIEPGSKVEAVGVSGGNLEVAPVAV